jgi:hypothetical protein
LQRLPPNRIPLKSYHKEGEKLEDGRNVVERSCNSGDGTDQRFQSLMFMLMMVKQLSEEVAKHFVSILLVWEQK